MDQGERATRTLARFTEPLSLYDRYGSMAYGIILQILPPPHLAQEVLVDLFTSPELRATADQPGNVAVMIIQLARLKALAMKARQGESLTQPIETNAVAEANLPQLVFTMAFCQGYSIDVIADKLQLDRKEILKAIRDHSGSFGQA